MVMKWIGRIGLVLVLGATSIRPAAGRSDDKITARSYFRLGKQLFARGRYKPAIEALQKAFQYWNHRVILFNIAYCYARLGDQPVAGRYLRQFLKRAPPREKKLPAELAAVLRATGVVMVKPPRAHLVTFLDGRKIGAGSVTRVVLAGRHVLELRDGDRVVSRTQLDVPGAGQRVWAPTRIHAPPALRAPPPRRRHTPGVVPGSPAPSRRQRLHWGWFVATASLAVALAGAAVGLGVVAKGRVDDYRADNALGLATSSQRKDAVNAMIGTNALWGAAGAAAITAGILAFFTRFRRTEAGPGARVRPTPGPGQLGLGLAVEFE